MDLLSGAAVLTSAMLFAGCIIVAQPSDEAPQVDSPRKSRSHRQRSHKPDATQPAPANVGPAPSLSPPVGPKQNPPLAVKPSPTGTTAATTVGLVPQPAKSPPPVTRARPQELTGDVGRGRPPGFKAGAAAAYWIWRGPRGGWRLRTTSQGQPHTFRGYIHGVTGDIVDVQSSRVEFADRVWAVDGSRTYAFSFKTSGHADGFIFSTRDEGCVRFDLQLDGGPQPKRILIGQGEHQPASNHFVVCPKGKAAAPSSPPVGPAKAPVVPRLRPR